MRTWPHTIEKRDEKSTTLPKISERSKLGICVREYVNERLLVRVIENHHTRDVPVQEEPKTQVNAA